MNKPEYYNALRNIANDPYYQIIQALATANQYSAEEIKEKRKERAVFSIQSQPYFKDKP